MADISGELLRDRFRGCLVGLAVGDALGMPVETLTAEEILVATGGHGVEGFLAPLQRRFHSTTLLKPGQWTDDTQLALAIARSLVRKRGFNLEDIAAEHIIEYRRGRRGWGGSTTIGIGELADGRRKAGDPVLDPEAHGLGNGVAMKIAPLALCYFTEVGTSAFTERVRALASLTHRDPCAAAGAWMVARLIVETLNDVIFVPTSPDPAAYAGLNHCAVHGQFDRRIVPPRIAAHVPIERLAATIGTSCAVIESVPFVLATATRGLTFRDSVLVAVNAGGDTDSNAAMVGAMRGAFHGLSTIPREWVDGLEAHDEIIALADQLFELASSRT